MIKIIILPLLLAFLVAPAYGGWQTANITPPAPYRINWPSAVIGDDDDELVIAYVWEGGDKWHLHFSSKKVFVAILDVIVDGKSIIDAESIGVQRVGSIGKAGDRARVSMVPLTDKALRDIKAGERLELVVINTLGRKDSIDHRVFTLSGSNKAITGAQVGVRKLLEHLGK